MTWSWSWSCCRSSSTWACWSARRWQSLLLPLLLVLLGLVVVVVVVVVDLAAAALSVRGLATLPFVLAVLAVPAVVFVVWPPELPCCWPPAVQFFLRCWSSMAARVARSASMRGGTAAAAGR